MTLQLWTQRDLIEIRRDMKRERPTDFWRKKFFGGAPHYSKNREIHFGDIEGTRAMAPFALPSSMGLPIFKERGAALKSFTPGYIKLLDAVRPEDATTMTVEELLEGKELDMSQRFDLRTAEISRQHITAIERTWDWMCARAVIDGAVTVKNLDSISQLAQTGATGVTITVAMAGLLALGAGGAWTLRRRTAQDAK